MFISVFAALAGVVFAFGLWPWSQVVKQTVEASYPLAAHGTLSVESASGDIRVTAYDGSVVIVTAHKEAGSQDELAHLAYAADRSGGDLTIKSDYPNFCSHCEISYDIQVPRAASIVAESASGKIAIERAGGPVVAKALSGDISIDGAAGAIRAKTASGDIAVTQAQGDVEAHAASGHVTVRYASLAAVRSIALEVASGEIALMIPRRAAAAIEASTISGDITSDVGSVREGYAGATLDQITGDGHVRVSLKAASGDISIKSD